MWGSGDDDIWAVGDGLPDAGRVWQGMGSDIFHGNGVQWSTQPAVTDRTLYAVHGSSASNAWIAGAGGTLLHFDGGTWSRTFPQSTVVTKPLYSVWGSSATDVWVVGVDAGVLHNDGIGWSASPLGTGPLICVHGTGPNDVWAVGWTDTLHYDGHAWSDRSLGLDAGLVTVWARTTDDVWGASEDDTLYHWSPASGWTWSYKLSSDSELSPDFRVSFWGSGPGDVYAGGWGVPAHFDGGTWGPVPTKTSLGIGSPFEAGAHFWGTGPNNVYGDVGNGEIFIWDGSGTWQFISKLGGVTPIGIAGSGPNDVWVIDREYSGAFHWDGAQWTMTQLPTSWLHSLTVPDPHNVWAVGDNGQILHLVH
jgi:hypothetical protein